MTELSSSASRTIRGHGERIHTLETRLNGIADAIANHVSRKELEELGSDIKSYIDDGDKDVSKKLDHIELKFGQLVMRLNATCSNLERRFIELGNPQLCYKGVWEEKVTYELGNFCTWQGGIWHCNRRTTDKPGIGGPSWTLAVKSGDRR